MTLTVTPTLSRTVLLNLKAGLEFDGGTAAICRADWPQCLVNETVVFGQIGRALFHLQVTSN